MKTDVLIAKESGHKGAIKNRSGLIKGRFKVINNNIDQLQAKARFCTFPVPETNVVFYEVKHTLTLRESLAKMEIKFNYKHMHKF